MELKRCVSCKRHRSQTFFKEDSEECNACALQSSLIGKTCTGCQRMLPHSKLRVATTGASGYMCAKCSPFTWEYDCTVCGLAKNVTDYRATPAELQKASIRRCVACEKCADCGLHFKDFRSFACNADKCVACYGRATAKKKCEVCKETKAATGFSRSQLHHASDITQNVAVRCQVCAF